MCHSRGNVVWAFDYTWPVELFDRGNMPIRRAVEHWIAAVVLCTLWPVHGNAQSKPGGRTCCAEKPSKEKEAKLLKGAAVIRFSARADALLGTAPANKGDWGLLIVDAESGETLFEKNADSYFVPASHEALHDRAGTREAGTRLPLSHHDRDARGAFERADALRRLGARGTRRSQSFESQVSV